MEKCLSPKQDDVGSSPASSADLKKEAKVACNFLECKYIRCKHVGLHERNEGCIEMRCELSGEKVKCVEMKEN